LALALLVQPMAAAAAIVFSDNFDDGDVSDWSMATNHGGTTAVTVRSDSVVSPSFALFTYLEPPPAGNDLYVHAYRDFLAPVTAVYSLDLWARSSPCSGCTISYEVLLDSNSIDRRSTPNAFEARAYDLGTLVAGTHRLSLGIYTTNASSGRFNASFDDLIVSTAAAVPAPATLALGALGLLGRARRRAGRRSTAPRAD
jgi:hypothetical protein